MRVAIEDILRKQNKTIYWLAKNTGCNYYALTRLCHNETNSISFETMENICKALNCKLDDIFKIEE